MIAGIGQPCGWLGEEDPSSEFILARASEGGSFLMMHRNGVSWHEAPIPPRRHLCEPQTVGWSGFNQIFRCACGAISDRPSRGWSERNSRQPAPAEERRRWWSR